MSIPERDSLSGEWLAIDFQGNEATYTGWHNAPHRLARDARYFASVLVDSDLFYAYVPAGSLGVCGRRGIEVTIFIHKDLIDG